MRRILAFIIDIAIIIVLLFIVDLVLFLFLPKETLVKFALVLDLIIMGGYLILVRACFKNTIGGKILSVDNTPQFGLFSRGDRDLEDRFPEEHLKKSETREVVIKNGCWDCPSCGTRSLEIYDVCKRCGQEIAKK